MIDYDLVKKAKELYQKADQFDKTWFSVKGVFKVANKVGIIDDADLKEISDEYDKVIAPVTQAKEKATDYMIDHTMKFLWNNNLVKKPKGK